MFLNYLYKGDYMEKSQRKPNRLKNYDYSRFGTYFITICTQNRVPILSNIVVGDGDLDIPSTHIQLSDVGKIVDAYIQKISHQYPHINVDQYIIMPDHIHMILTITQQANNTTISTVIGWFKYQTTKQINILYDTLGQRIWQRSYHDHIVRNEQDYQNIAQYIQNNPLKWANKHQT